MSEPNVVKGPPARFRAGPVNYAEISGALAAIDALLGTLKTDASVSAPRLPAARDALALLKETVEGLVHEAVAERNTGVNPETYANEEIARRPRPDHRLRCTPVFIVGCRRSGTTLLSWLLDSHPDVAALPENYVCSSVLPLTYSIVNAAAALGESHGAFLRRIADVIEGPFCDYALRQGKRRWVSKEVFLAETIDVLDRVFNYQSKFIFLVRHGFDVAFSAAERFEIRGHHARPRRSTLAIENYVREWVEVNENTLAFCLRNRVRSFFLRYEDFVARPREIAPALFAFIEEPWSDSIFEQMQSQKHALGLGDNKILETGGRIERDRGNRWHVWPNELKWQLGAIANPMLERFGYDPIPIHVPDAAELFAIPPVVAVS